MPLFVSFLKKILFYHNGRGYQENPGRKLPASLSADYRLRIRDNWDTHQNIRGEIRDGPINITISGKLGSDARPYQESDVEKALERIKNEKK